MSKYNVQCTIENGQFKTKNLRLRASAREHFHDLGVDKMKLRTGIIGCAKILYAALILPAWQCKDLELYGIASRNFQKAQSYAAQCKIPQVYRDYDALLADETIDLVYIALPNHLHWEMVVKAAEARKHILVEKPICLYTMDFAAIRSAWGKSRIQLLEGIMVQHHPWQSYIKQFIGEHSLGSLQKINTQISFIPKYDLKDNYRSHPEYGGGCFFDLAPYWLQFIQSIMGLEPDAAEGWSAFDGVNRCDFTFSARMEFPDGVEANFRASFEQPYAATHEMIFEDGRLKVENFFAANLGNRKITLQVENWRSGGGDVVEFPPQNYYRNQLLFFTQVLKGVANNIDLRESGQRVKIMEEIYRNAKHRLNSGGSQI
jgi:NDP-hexose-3-ketoreductase